MRTSATSICSLNYTNIPLFPHFFYIPENLSLSFTQKNSISSHWVYPILSIISICGYSITEQHTLHTHCSPLECIWLRAAVCLCVTPFTGWFFHVGGYALIFDTCITGWLYHCVFPPLLFQLKVEANVHIRDYILWNWKQRWEICRCFHFHFISLLFVFCHKTSSSHFPGLWDHLQSYSHNSIWSNTAFKRRANILFTSGTIHRKEIH